jgi:hypothetical protein
MANVEVLVEEVPGAVHLVIRPEGGKEQQVIVLTGPRARQVGDELFKAGCNAAAPHQ